MMEGSSHAAAGEFVPEVVELAGVFGEILRGGVGGFGDVGEHLFGELGLDGDVDGGEIDAGPGGTEGDVGGLGVEPEVELVADVVDELGVVGGGVEAAAHDDDALGEFGEVGIDGDGERDVGERAGGVDSDLVRMGVDLPDEEVGGVLVEGFSGGLALVLLRDDIGAVVGLAAGAFGDISPSPVPGRCSVEGLIDFGFGLGADEGKDGSGDNGDIGPVDKFKHAEGVVHLFGLPGVAADHGDSEHLRLW